MQTATREELAYEQPTFNQKKKTIAMEMLKRNAPVTKISEQHNVSRKYAYQQQEKARNAIDNCFDNSNQDDDKVLFYLPITKNWIQQFIICLALNCRACFRGIIMSAQTLFDLNISIGTISNIIKKIVEKVKAINSNEDLSGIKIPAFDEMFHHNKPVLAGIDTKSLYCFTLAQEEHRDTDTWAIHMLDAQSKGLNHENAIADDGKGLRAGHKYVFPNTPCSYDNFHLIKLLIETRRFFRNRLKSATSYRIDLDGKIKKASVLGQHHKHAKKLGDARKHEKEMKHLSQTIDTLVSWMEHDILEKAGQNLETRSMLYDFVLSEFQKLADMHPHRLKNTCTTLKNQKTNSLAFVETLGDKFAIIAEENDCDIETVWNMCELQRCNHYSEKYAIRMLPIYDVLTDKFDAVEDAVIDAINNTERTSSAVENLNSRLSSYFFLRREIGHGFLVQS